jgi:hypothetical protein
VQKPLDLFLPLVSFGALIGLSSAGFGTHAAYRLTLMVAFAAWRAWIVRDAERTSR